MAKPIIAGPAGDPSLAVISLAMAASPVIGLLDLFGLMDATTVFTRLRGGFQMFGPGL